MVLFTGRFLERAARVDAVGIHGSNCMFNILEAQSAREKQLWNGPADSLSNRPIKDAAGAAAECVVLGVEKDRFDVVLDSELHVEVGSGGERFDDVAAF